MKKPIQWKKVFAAICILTGLLFFIPEASFAWNGCVFSRSGTIDGLIFPFADEEAGVEGLELDLNPDPENPILPVFVVTDVVVLGSGKEKSYITPFNQFIYRTKLKNNQDDDDWDDDDWDTMQNGEIIAYIKENETPYSQLVFTFKKVRMFETYRVSQKATNYACENDIEPDVPADRTKMKIYFEAKKAELINVPGVSAKFNILLILKKGIADLTLVPVP